MKIKIIINILLSVLIIITCFLNLLIQSKLGISGLLLILIFLINMKIKKLETYRKFLIAILLIIIPFMYKTGFTSYNIHQNPILFSQEYNDTKCIFNNEESTFYIEGSGKSPSYESHISVDWKQYKKGIYNVIIDEQVTTIGSHLFSNCISLVKVDVSNNINVIGNYSFAECTKLSSFNTEEKYTIVIPKNTTIIGESAFYNCIRIQNLYLSKNITKIYDNAFNCPNLTNVYYNGTEEEWEQISFGNNIFPDNIKIHYNQNF